MGKSSRQVLEQEGLTYRDRFGQPKPCPEVAIEKESKLLFARLLREIGAEEKQLPDWLKKASLKLR